MSESLESPWQQTSLLPLVDTPTTSPAASADQLLILDTETTGLDPEATRCWRWGPSCSLCRSEPCWRSCRF